MDMHRSGRTGDQDGQYIRLRYSMQFIRGGQPHTIEVEVSVPVGASAEERDQLIREAEANIEQMYRQIEKRSAGRIQQPAESSRPQAVPAQAGPHPAPSTTPARAPAPPAPAVQVAAQANVRDTSQTGSPPGRHETAETAAPARSSIGSEMPSTHNLDDATSGTIKLREFIQIIRERWSISPKDAMDLLQVRNLNDMNYRDLLKQLEPLVEQRGKATANAKSTGNAPRTPSTPAPVTSAARQPAPSSPAAPASAMRDASVKPASPSPPARSAPPANAANRTSSPAPAVHKPATPAAPPAPALDGPANIPVYPLPASTLREVPRSYKFDEEEEEEDDDTEKAQGGAGEDENGMSEALARIKIDELRENRGNTVVSPARLTVLHNLLDSQISDEQFQQLIEGLWNINSDKKLKQDQVEALISWAKEDYFEDEVRAVIAVLKG